jgi:hypothetical protein
MRSASAATSITRAATGISCRSTPSPP